MLAYLNRLIRFDNPQKKEWIIYFVCFLLLNVPALYNYYQKDFENAYLLFAQSLAQGKLTLPAMDYYGDMIQFKGQYYLPYPPMPAFLLLPFVFLFGAANCNIVLIALMISFINLVLLYRIFIRTQVDPKILSWCLLAFFFASPYWYAFFTTHSVYAFAHISSLLFQLLCIYEFFGKRRMWLMGLYIGCSMLCRQFTVFYMLLPVAFVLFSEGKSLVQKFRSIALLFFSFGLVLSVYLLINYIRFGNPLDTGYAYILYQGELKDRVEMHGVFSYRYFLFNLYSYFLKGFNIIFGGKDFLSVKDMDLWGTSLLSASPFVIFGFRRGIKPLYFWTFLTVIALTITGTLFYHNNGFHQVNAIRFALDFFPLLMVLVATGVKPPEYWILRAMIIYGVFLNVIAFIIHYLRH